MFIVSTRGGGLPYMRLLKISAARPEFLADFTTKMTEFVGNFRVIFQKIPSFGRIISWKYCQFWNGVRKIFASCIKWHCNINLVQWNYYLIEACMRSIISSKHKYKNFMNFYRFTIFYGIRFNIVMIFYFSSRIELLSSMNNFSNAQIYHISVSMSIKVRNILFRIHICFTGFYGSV